MSFGREAVSFPKGEVDRLVGSLRDLGSPQGDSMAEETSALTLAGVTIDLRPTNAELGRSFPRSSASRRHHACLGRPSSAFCGSRENSSGDEVPSRFEPRTTLAAGARVCGKPGRRRTRDAQIVRVGCDGVDARNLAECRPGRAVTRGKDLFDFLDSRGARKNCPLCGHEDWHGWDERVSLPHALGSTAADKGTDVFPLTCANCGFIRLQSAHVLDDPRTP
jgi:hypothetical protein